MVETSSEIDNVIHLLIKTKVSGYIMLCNWYQPLNINTYQDPRFMDFLGNLCVCDGWAIPSTQSEFLFTMV